MLMRTDPFRELDRLTQQVLGSQTGTWSRPTAMPMDAYRDGDTFVVAFDLPGVDPERDRPRRRAQRAHGQGGAPPGAPAENVEMQVAERPLGVFSRQLFLGDTLDTERIDAELRGRRADPAHPDRGARQAAQDRDRNADSGHQQINA